MLVVRGKGRGPPEVADRCLLALSNPAVPDTRQPYHAVMRASASPHRAAQLEQRLVSAVRRATTTAVRRLLAHYRRSGRRPRRAGIVVGSVIDPMTIANDHIRAHALEGRLFRTVLEQALRSRGVSCAITVERAVYARAARELKRGEAELKRAVTELGRSLDGPWRADEKTATLAAWMALG